MITQVPLSVNHQHPVMKLHIKGAYILFSIITHFHFPRFLSPSFIPLQDQSISQLCPTIYHSSHLIFLLLTDVFLFIYLLCGVKCVSWNLCCFVFFSLVFYTILILTHWLKYQNVIYMILIFYSLHSSTTSLLWASVQIK